MVKAIFWSALGCVVYVYLGYPALLLSWRTFARRAVQKQDREPSVSIVIAMHNESKNVRAKMQNCCELDYPLNKLQLIISLDAPTDGTDLLIRQYTQEGVDIAYSATRKGKAAAINNGMALARGEIVVFADAAQRFEKSAIRELVANFADESVGAVSGELILLDETSNEAGDAVGMYWRYEKALRAMESEIHSVAGATGAIYAIRREFFVPLAPETILDDVVIPMRIVLAGKRVIFEPAARAYDVVSQSPNHEYERKTRTLAGNYQLLLEMPKLLVPFRNPIFVQFVSHKVGRLLVPYGLAAVFVSNLFLLDGGVYLLLFVCQALWYLLAFAGWLVSTRAEVQYDTTPQSVEVRTRL